jgi:hypothetical protein
MLRRGAVAERLNAPVLKPFPMSPQVPAESTTYGKPPNTLPSDLPAELVEVIRAWSTLPHSLRQAIRAVVHMATV